jgi:23S rRNA G2445 N2-methylase RlmL
MGKLSWYFAPCGPGLEGILEGEVAEAGGSRIRADRGGVTFQGEQRVGYRLALWSRVGIRVLEELARERVSGPDDLYAMAGRIPWHKRIRPGQTFAVFSAVSGPRVRHGQYAALRIKDAIVDQLRDRTGERPDVDRDDPDLPLKLVVRNDLATLSRDLAGDSLHRRGWRPIQVKSPLNEALAAGLLQLAGWDRRSALCDPMCGSGTFLVEAAHLAGDRAPGLRRPFALERWSDHDADLWASLRAEAEARWEAGRANIPPLLGNDAHAGALAIARDAAARAEVADLVELTEGDVSGYAPAPAPGLVVVNPPYGVRLEEAGESWQRLGDFLRGLPGGEAWVLSGDPELTRNLRMRSTRRVPVTNGGIDCRWLRYPLGPDAGGLG